MLKYNGRIITKNDRWIGVHIPPIPENTIRLRFTVGHVPQFAWGDATCIDSERNIWDLTTDNWYDFLSDQTELLEILGGNTSNITFMADAFWGCTKLYKVALFDTSNVTYTSGMFWGCTALEEVPLFDLSNCENAHAMFEWCSSLKHIPLFNTSKLETACYMFSGCNNVESGAYALYQQMVADGVEEHTDTFTNCGSNTVTGAAELAQIPSSWGGTGA